MRNYVLMLDVADKILSRDILSQLKKIFNRNRVIKEEELTYFSFAAKDLPGIHDLIQNMINLNDFTESDFIALFYTREEDPDLIHRLMILGTENTIDQDLQNKISNTTHENILSELLEFDFMKIEK